MASKDRVERRLAAIFSADIAGYSRLIGVDELGTLRDLMAHREKMDGLIAHHGGRVANTAGDSVLAEFPSVVDAVECAVDEAPRSNPWRCAGKCPPISDRHPLGGCDNSRGRPAW